MPAMNEFMSKVAEGKWLSGSEHPTMLDIHCVPVCEFIVCWSYSEHFKHVTDSADFAGKAPNMLALVEKFRAHDAFKDLVINREAGNKHWDRTMGWEEGVKCQLSIEVLKGCVEGELLA